MLTTQPNTFYLQRISFLVVLWAFADTLSNWRKCFLNLQVFFFYLQRFFLWLCCEYFQRVLCQIDESVFLIYRCFFLFAAHFFFWLCCEHLQRVRCQIDESVSLICRCFFYLQRVKPSRPPYYSDLEALFINCKLFYSPWEIHSFVHSRKYLHSTTSAREPDFTETRLSDHRDRAATPGLFFNHS